MLGEVGEDLFEAQVVVNKAQLTQVLSTLTTKLNQHDEVIQTLLTDLKTTNKNITSFKQTVMDHLTNLKRQITSHDSQLRLAQQTADVSVSTTQFNGAVFDIKEEMKVFGSRLFAVEEHTKPNLVGDYVSGWYKDVCLKESAEREAQLELNIHSQLERGSVGDLRAILDGCVSEDKVQLWLDSLRTDVIRNRKNSNEELDRLGKLVFENEKAMDRILNKFDRQTEGKFGEVMKRITTIFDLMSISEAEAMDVTNAHGPLGESGNLLLMQNNGPRQLSMSGSQIGQLPLPAPHTLGPRGQQLVPTRESITPSAMNVPPGDLSDSQNTQAPPVECLPASTLEPQTQNGTATPPAAAVAASIAPVQEEQEEAPTSAPAAAQPQTAPAPIPAPTPPVPTPDPVAAVPTPPVAATPTPLPPATPIPTPTPVAAATTLLGRPASNTSAGSDPLPAKRSSGPTHIDGDIDEKTALLMQSPVFLSFRHQILRDIGDRLASNQQTQSSDFDIELLDIRNELRQRVTPQRVIELLKQYSDSDTPAKVVTIHRRLQEVEIDKVSHAFLNEALRAKGDLHIVEQKADRTMLGDMNEGFKKQLSDLQAEFDSFKRDRNEFQVLKEVLKQQQLTHMHPQLTGDGMEASAKVSSPLGGPQFTAAAAGGGAYLPVESLGGSARSINHSPLGVAPDMMQAMSRLVTEEDTALEVQRKAAESLPSIRTPQRAFNTHIPEYNVPKSPDPTYLPSAQGVDRRAKDAVLTVDDSKKLKESKGRDPIQDALRAVQVSDTPEPPVRRDANSRQGKRAPSVRPLTDHRQRDREMNAMLGFDSGTPGPPASSSSARTPGASDAQSGSIVRDQAGSPISMIPAKASIPQPSKLKPGAGPPMITPTTPGAGANPRKLKPGSRRPLTQEAVVPMTTSQKAYAHFVAEANALPETEKQPVVPYKDLKTREIPVQHNV